MPQNAYSQQNSRFSSLKNRLIGAARWTLIGHFISQGLRFGSNLVLTRLLFPDTFGVMSVGYMVFTGLTMISDIGLGSIIARSSRGTDSIFLNVVWVSQVARGILIAFGGLGISVLFYILARYNIFPRASVYADPRIPALIAILSFSTVLEGLESTKSQLARRDLKLAILTKIELITQLFTTTVILIWAWLSPTIWSLAAGLLFGLLAKAVLSHVMLPGPRNRFEWDRSSFSEIWEFGKWAMVSSPLTFLFNSGDRLLLGSLLSATVMGIYSIAFLLVTAFQTVVVKIMGASVLPALSEILRERPNELRRSLYRVRLPLDVACLVAAGALFVSGSSIIGFLYDSRYAEAGWMLSAVSITLATTQFNVFDQCLIALGRMKALTGLNAARMAVMYVSIPIGYMYGGMTGAIVAVPISSLINTVILLILQAKLDLIDLKHEIRILPLFGIGMLGGFLLKIFLDILRPLLHH